MSDQTQPPDHVYERLTGWRRWAIVVSGAVAGAMVALLFSAFGGRPTPLWEIIIGMLGGALLGFSASLGEARRSTARREKPSDDQPPSPPRGE